MEDAWFGATIHMGAKLGEATDVSGSDEFSSGVEDVLDFAAAKFIGGFRLVDIVGSGRAAADFCILHLYDLEIGNLSKDASRRIGDMLGMAKMARVLVGNLDAAGWSGRCLDANLLEKDGDVLYALNEGLGLCLLGFTLEHQGVFMEPGAAASGIGYDGIDIFREGLKVGTSICPGGPGLADMPGEGAATLLAGGNHDLDAVTV